MKKNVIIFFLVSLAGLSINSCQKDNNNQNQSSNHNDTTKTLPRPVVSISQTPLTILLPNNCQQSFTITNTGPQGSMLSYTVEDNGALGGFLQFNTTSGNGALAAGASVTFTVMVKPDFANDAGLIGASLVLNVYTPNASNYTKIPVPVNIGSIDVIAQSLIGKWSGTWSGQQNPFQGSLPVSGTWTMNITAIDTAASTVAGSITMTGTDAFSTTFTPINFTIPLNPSTASFNYNDASYVPTPANAQCKVITLMISNGNDNAVYTLVFDAEINTATNAIIPGSGGFQIFYNGQGSQGSVAGSKQQ